MDRFLEALESVDTAKTSPFGYSFVEVLFFERMLADRACNPPQHRATLRFPIPLQVSSVKVRPGAIRGFAFLSER
jgi:hypothetical protein